jgi:hypothetical protein
MSYLRGENQMDGVHVLFDDADSSGTFNEIDIAKLQAGVKYQVKFVLNLENQTTKVFINNALVHTGGTWLGYYQQSGNGPVPATNSLIFQARGTGDSADQGHGYLIDNVQLASS